MRSLLVLLVLLVLLLPATGCLLEQRYDDDRANLPFGCRVDSDCSLGRICDRNLCVEGCRDDADCPEGRTCGEGGCEGGSADAG